MSELLDFAIAAHGGMDRWRSLSSLTVSASVGGALWPAKGKAGILDDVQAEVNCHQQRVICSPFTAPDRRSVYELDRVIIETTDGRIVQTRDNPRAAFRDHKVETQWDDSDLVYFSGYAVWNYLTTPFMLAIPGFTTQEIDPWHENGENWRRLQVTFPSYIATHSREQTFYFDRQGLLRRLDYQPEVIGAVPVAHYASELKDFSGIIVPARRRAFLRGSHGKPIQDHIAVAIDISDVKVA
jgi:hypothetical protein